MSPRRNRTTLGLLDTVVILVLAFTADLFLLWMASQILGLNLFEHLPGWLMALSKSIWSYVTGAASSILLGFLRRRINTSTRTPNYLLWSGGTAAAILLALTLVMSSIVRPLPVNGAVQTSEFTLKFYARPPGNADKAGQSQGSDLGPLLAFQQRTPKIRQRENIALQPGGFYKTTADLPSRCEQFMARVYRVATESEMLGDPTSPPIEISFFRSPKDPVAARVEVIEECVDGSGCSISKVDLGWASDGKACNLAAR